MKRPTNAGEESPRHGYQGDRASVRAAAPAVPRSLTIAITREAGARGGTISRRVGKKLGWQVYDQEMLEYIAQEEAHIQETVDALTAVEAAWVDERTHTLGDEEHPSVRNLARTILALGAQGEVVLVGRGAGFLLPAPTTLHVRIVAPLEDRIAYMSQWMRLTQEEAAEQVAQRDRRRTEFVTTHFHGQPDDVYRYDLLLNSSLLGEDLCVELIAHAARAKLAAAEGEARDHQ
jgi:cytidylate kinase